MERKWKEKKGFAVTKGILFLMFVFGLVTVWEWSIYKNIETEAQRDDGQNMTEYKRHYVMISGDSKSTMWNDIYQEASEAGKEKEVLVERFCDWLTDDYTAEDYMNIAIQAKVDGIIVQPDGTQKMRNAIDQAAQAGIPVVTVLQDESDTKRISFVGLNSYQLGMSYGEQILRCLDENTRNVLVLLNENDAGKELVFKQLKATVMESGLADQVRIQPMTIRSKNTFDTEEQIRDIFIEQESRPDILVCMNEADSVRAYQAMIDYNCVGSVEIIGYYQSETILEAIQKEIIPVAVLLDCKQIGRDCVAALEEYAEMGYVSNYISVDIHIATKDNIEDYLAETES